MDKIEPDHFDVVVVSSGLPEVLIGSALARAGKSVLLLDSTESYGGSWASLSGPDYVHGLINRQLEYQLSAKQQQQQQQQQQGQQQQDAPSQEGAGSSSSEHCSIALHAVHPLLGASGVSLYTHPDVEQALENKHLLMDLAPRVLYQDEAMVGLLVACQAHNYLEFKLIEGSYIYLSGKLRPVPASRAELFADKALPLAAKRCLGRFLAGCVEAQQGCGRLKDAFDGRPLVELLAAEGLDEQLQQVVLYGIAMADTPQQQQQHQQTGLSSSSQAAGTTTTPPPLEQRPEAAKEASQAAGQSDSSSSSSSSGSLLLTAAQGLAALQLYSSSLGRYGGAGAFMAPCYGSGSLPEAFVRLAAVKGAVTALRHGAVKLELLQGQQQQQDQQQLGAGEGSGSSGSSSSKQTSSASDAAATGPLKTGEAGAATASAAVADSKAAAAAAKVAVLLASCQRLTANAVVACSAVAPSCSAAAHPCSSSTVSAQRDKASPPQQQQQLQPQHQVSCAVALLDGSVVDGESSLLLVFPPGSLGQHQAAVIRGLQLGPAFGVAPPGKYMLYLSAVLPGSIETVSSSSSSSLAEQVLAPALQTIAAGKGLQAFEFMEEGQQEAGQQQQQQAAESSSQQPQEEQQQQALPSLLPQVLAVCYFTSQQPVQQFFSQPATADTQQHSSSSSSSSSSSPGSAVLWCPPAAQGFVGYTQTVKAAEAAYRQQFPGLPWLTDPVPSAAAPAAAAASSSDEGPAGAGAAAAHEAAEGSGGVDGGAGGGVLDDCELDAIDELTAALLELSAPPKEQ